MTNPLRYAVLLTVLAVVIGEKQIKLEDIERDNLLSERQTNGGPRGDPIESDQGQHLRQPGPAYETSGDSGENNISDDIIYAQPGGSSEEYSNEQQIQYVTPQQEQSYASRAPAELYTRPVHEAGHTYSAPARQSLNNPIISKLNPSPSPYLSQQPRYVYVQAGQQQLSPSGVITYGQPENIQQQAHDDITYASVEQNQILENSQQAVHAPPARPSLNYGARSYIQYVPLLAQTPNHQNYIMVLPFRNIPTHTQAYTVPNIPIQYQNHHASLATVPQQHQTHLLAPQPTIAYTPTVPAQDNSVLHAPDTTAIPSPAIHYTITPSHQLTSLPQAASLQYAPQQLQVQPSLEYVLPPKQTIEYQAPASLHKSPHLAAGLQYTQNYAQSFTPTLDFFGAYNNKHPKSLLDSYIPSSVILAHQRALGRQIYNHHAPSIVQQQHGTHQPGYNTIAYSTYQGYGHSKRSPISITTNTLNNKKN